jgi:hypothetical protein
LLISSNTNNRAKTLNFRKTWSSATNEEICFLVATDDPGGLDSQPIAEVRTLMVGRSSGVGLASCSLWLPASNTEEAT